VFSVQEPAACDLKVGHLQVLKGRLDALEERARSKLYSRGFTAEQVSATRFLNLRFQGTEVALMIASAHMEDYQEAFLSAYKREFGFLLSGRVVVVDDVRWVSIRRTILHFQVQRAPHT
jgi:5-oxoprolinase (ATP-hydrolysing)